MILASGGEMFLSGCTIQGGHGGDGAELSPGACDIPPSNGGDGTSVPNRSNSTALFKS